MSEKKTKKKKHTGGKKPRYYKAEAMQKKIDEYFKKCDDEGDNYTVTGLALHLGFLSRHAIIDYEKEDVKRIEENEKKAIAHTIKKAKLKIEQSLESKLQNSKQVAGIIFNLKNNYGYVDRTDLAHTGTIEVKITGLKDGEF